MPKGILKGEFRNAHQRARHVSRRYSYSLSDQHAADRRSRQANRAYRRDHSRRDFTIEIHRGFLERLTMSQQKAPATCRGFRLRDVLRAPSASRLGFAASLGQDELGIAVRLLASLEDEIAGRLESDAIETGRHRPVQRVALVLAVDHDRHAL